MISHTQAAKRSFRQLRCSRIPILLLSSVPVILLGIVIGFGKHDPPVTQSMLRPGLVETSLPMPAPHLMTVQTEVESPAKPPGTGGVDEIVSACEKRFTKTDRLIRIKEAGGTLEIEDSVIKALQYLKQTQQADGSWTGGPAMTGLAALAYLGQGEAPGSPEFGEPWFKAILSLVELGKKNHGNFTNKSGEENAAYEHGIATYALAEAALWCERGGYKFPNLNEATRQAGQFIIDHQHASGGWDSRYTQAGGRGGDLSTTVWQLMALSACANTKLEFRDMTKCVTKSLSYISSLQAESGAFACTNQASPVSDTHTLTGAGILCFQIWGKGSSADPRKGARYSFEHSKFDYNSEFADLYGHFFESQAMINRGGEQWKHYSAMTLKQLLANQNPDGSWKAPGGGKAIRSVAPQSIGNTHSRTCLSVLMLEVYYQYLSTIPLIRIERGG